MGSLTANGYPYPVGTDRVMDGDDAIKALADKIELRLRGGVWSSNAGVATAVPIGGNKLVAVTYPAGVFTGTPNAVVTPWDSSPQSHHVGINGMYPTSVNVIAINTGAAIADIYFTLLAQQA